MFCFLSGKAHLLEVLAKFDSYERRITEALREDNLVLVLSALTEAAEQDETLLASAGRERRARFLFRLGRWEEALDDVDWVITREREVPPRRVVGALLTSARISAQMGHYAEAVSTLERATQMADENEVDPTTGAAVHIEFASLLYRIGEEDRAVGELTAGEALTGSIEDARKREKMLAFAEVQKGLECFRGRRLDQALFHYKEALRFLKPRNSPTLLQADTFRYLGVLYSLKSEPLESLKNHRRALRTYCKLQAPLGQAKTYNSLGQTCLALSRLDEALFFMKKAEFISRKLGADSESATVYGKMGLIYAELGDYEKAVDYHWRDVDSCRRFGNYRALAYSMRNLGLSYMESGEFEEALHYLWESLSRFRELQDQPHQAKVLLSLGQTLMELGRLPEAEELLEEAIELLEEMGKSDADLGISRLLMGKLHRSWQNLSVANSSLISAQRILEESGGGGPLAETYLQLGLLAYERHQEADSLRYLKQAITLAKRLELRDLMVQALNAMERLEDFGLVDLLVEELSLSLSKTPQ